MKHNKQLRYILVIGLLQSEIMYLIQNLSTDRQFDTEQNNICHIYIYDLPEEKEQDDSCDSCQTVPLSGSLFLHRKKTQSFAAEFFTFSPEQTLLLTADGRCLELADRSDMASIAYLMPGQTCFYDENGKTLHADMYVEGFEEIDRTFLLHVYERHHSLPWKILETKRCIVQEFSMEWLPALYELYEQDGMTDYIEPLYDMEKEREYQRAYIENMYCFYGFGMWIVLEKETKKLIGRAGLECREELDGELELGYAIGVPFQRKGYATEVCTAILSYAKEKLDRKEICCMIEEENQKSVCLARKLGFEFECKFMLDGKRMYKYTKKL